MVEVGFKIWIMELIVLENDVNKKVVVLENLMIFFFSYLVVEGIMLWGFWDGVIYNVLVKLFEGLNLMVYICILLENIL